MAFAYNACTVRSRNTSAEEMAFFFLLLLLYTRPGLFFPPQFLFSLLFPSWMLLSSKVGLLRYSFLCLFSAFFPLSRFFFIRSVDRYLWE